jgi:hypothetical protein
MRGEYLSLAEQKISVGAPEILGARGMHVARDPLRMNTELIGWRPLSIDAIADLPEEPAVFEVANLVRSIQYIGSAEDNLRTSLTALAQDQTKFRAIPGGWYFRYERVAQADEALTHRLTAYRAKHGGQLPPANRDAGRSLRVASRRAAA